MPLEEYSRKRKFDLTPEPKPDKPREQPPQKVAFFCVQRHDASHLHYDFRLEVNGVLVSWAVPKGPSLDPKRKPLAMKVEDHPFAYGTFEGNIPKGEYGGGSVMLWDTGTYEVLGEPEAAGQIERGDFKFKLDGHKLKGGFAIVRMKHAAKGNEWLLIKKPDEFAIPGYDIDQYAWSVKTKRTQDEIAQEETAPSADQLEGAQKAPLPRDVTPMLATAVTKPPAGDQWVYEVKWDGVRAICVIENGHLQMVSRRGNQCDAQYPELSGLPNHVTAKTAVLDGEICVLDENGRSRFQLIQPRIGIDKSAAARLAQDTPATLFLFDVLYADGYDLRGATLWDRKQLLSRIILPSDHIRVSEVYETDGAQMFEAAAKMGLEGILAKDRHSTYDAKRSKAWLKLKVLNEQEFVIAGYTAGERDYFGALILGVHDGANFVHAGQVGTGFDAKKMKIIHEQLRPLETKTCPFTTKAKIKGATWVQPELVCQVRFLEWTAEGMLRAPVFVALRQDKNASEVTREPASSLEPPTPEPTPEPTLEPDKPAKRAPKKSKALPKSEPAPSKIEALDFSGREATLEVDGRRLKFSNLEKVFYPKQIWKKRDLLSFYDRVSPWLLPHLKDRPLSMKRYPNGIDQPFFFQKDAAKGFPEWMACHIIREGHPPKDNHYVVANERATLLYVVNLGCIDHNPWLSRIGSLDNPDWILIDLDPVDSGFDKIVDAALLVRDVLSAVGLRGYPKTTGGDGMHVYVPLDPIYTYDQVRSFAEILSHLVIEREPNLFTTPRSVDKRKKDRVYFDYLQIGTGKTIAAPYVLRAYDQAPVATPLAWDEVRHGLHPTDFRIDNAIERFERVGDLFAPVLQGGQRLDEALALVKDLSS